MFYSQTLGHAASTLAARVGGGSEAVACGTRCSPATAHTFRKHHRNTPCIFWVHGVGPTIRGESPKKKKKKKRGNTDQYQYCRINSNDPNPTDRCTIYNRSFSVDILYENQEFGFLFFSL